MSKAKPKSLLPFQLTADELLTSLPDMVRVIIDETERQVKDKGLRDEGAIEDFRISCDALNFWRLELRCREELGLQKLDTAHADMLRQVARGICEKRSIAPDDFLSAQLATMDRVRLPWGFTSLQLAISRAKRRPIKLLHPDLVDAPLPSLLAATALELTEMEAKKDGVILLPIDSVRNIVKQRKIVVAGAIARLVNAGVLECSNPKYRIGKAREFIFIGKPKIDYEPRDDEKAEELTEAS